MFTVLIAHDSREKLSHIRYIFHGGIVLWFFCKSRAWHLEQSEKASVIAASDAVKILKAVHGQAQKHAYRMV